MEHHGDGRGRDLVGLLPNDEAMVITGERSTTVTRFLEEEGRAPSSIRRSYLVAGTYSGATPTVPQFLSLAEDLQRIGMTDVVIYWPSDPENEGALERLAADALPQLANRTDLPDAKWRTRGLCVTVVVRPWRWSQPVTCC